MNIISDEDATELYNICKNITIPLMKFKDYGPDKQASRMGRAQQFGNHRSALLGYVYKRNQPRSMGRQLSAFSIKQPELYDCLIKLADKYFPEHKWTSIQLNHNLTCTPHFDKHNNGASIIFSVGDYIGSNLCVENTEHIIEYNTHNTIISFDGSQHKHWNTPLLSGTKYSFVFYA
jgi:hypothetical protein